MSNYLNPNFITSNGNEVVFRFTDNLRKGEGILIKITRQIFPDFCFYIVRLEKSTSHYFTIKNLLEIFINRQILSEKLFYLCKATPQWSAKVLLKLSSSDKFSQNLKWNEDDSNSTTSLVCTAIIGFSHILWCGLLFYPFQRQMREACQLDKAISSHTFLFYNPLSSGNCEGI